MDLLIDVDIYIFKLYNLIIYITEVSMKKQVIVVSDFDGTISVKDVNRSLFHTFGNEKNKEIEMQYKNNKIGLIEDLSAQYKAIGISKKTFDDYVRSNMKIDETFFELVDYAKQNGIKVAVVSGGFINYVKLLYEKYGRNIDIPVYSNLLVEKDGIMVPKYTEAPICTSKFGPCGICKMKHVQEYKKHYTVVYAGDGSTDRCAAHEADTVFAKGNLLKYCIDNGIQYHPFSSFEDIETYLKKVC
jgi:2-hydroxy-3-keto-5-methylthiopentenyl-1-phosphate phosphatase